MGIIPAYAGNTVCVSACDIHVRDHPRVCGEHISVSGFAPAVMGSSPRMRGTPFADGVEHAANGIIPAYAGNTHRMRRPYPTSGDHPRVCGEHHFAYEKLIGKSGSSPRMRGTLQLDIELRGVCGIIPAYAGNTR